MIDLAAKNAFWSVVEDCLVEIHKLPLVDARGRVSKLRSQIDHPPLGLSGDVIYHDEPFDVACDLAGNHLGLASHRNQYDGILQRHKW
jgi:hypothetical protein